jgi:hypothetical protein
VMYSSTCLVVYRCRNVPSLLPCLSFVRKDMLHASLVCYHPLHFVSIIFFILTYAMVACLLLLLLSRLSISTIMLTLVCWEAPFDDDTDDQTNCIFIRSTITVFSDSSNDEKDVREAIIRGLQERGIQLP